MVYIKHNFFGEQLFEMIQDYCQMNDFEIKKAGEKEFWVLPTPDSIIPLLEKDGYKLILTFIRKANKDIDTDLRIHNDGIINGHRTDLASIVYLSNNEGVTDNGTMFYKHKEWGIKAPENIPDKEFDRLIVEDANNNLCWKRTDYVSAEPNKMVTYDASLFHSKYPRVIEKGERIVLVNFYKKI